MKSNYLGCLKSNDRHTEIPIVKTIDVADLFGNLALYSSWVYLSGTALLVIENFEKSWGVHSIWINAGVFKAFTIADAQDPNSIVPRTKINPAHLWKGKLTRSKLTHELLVEKRASVMLTRHSLPSIAILPADAIDRVPKALVELVRHRRANKTAAMIERTHPPVEVSGFSIEEEICRLMERADRGRKKS